MGNTILTPDIIAKEALITLENNLVAANLVHRDYSEEFVNVGDTITVRKPATFTATNFNGTITRQDIKEGSVTVAIDRHRDVSFAVSSKELTLDIADFSARYISPAMRAIAQAIDADIMNEVANVSQFITAKNGDNLEDIANLAKTLDIAKVPMDQRRLVLHPDHKYRYALKDNLSKVAYAGNGQTLRDAELGRIYNFDTYMDQNAPASAAVTPGNATAFKVTGTAGQDTVNLTEVSAAGATFKIGDTFILDGYMYRVAADATASGGNVTGLKLDQPLAKTAAAKSAYIVNKVHSLAFHRNAIALVTRPLALPMGASNAAIMSDNGLGVRVVYGYNQDTKTDTISLDVIYGIKTLDNTMAVKLLG